MCSLLCVGAILISSSSTIRAAALNALDNVKMIFVQDDDTGEIVQKPANEAYLRYNIGGNTNLDDTEISKKVGYKISYPKQVGDATFGYKTLAVSFKNVPYDLDTKIYQLMLKSVENDDALCKLSEYTPLRNTLGAYVKVNTDVVIATALAKNIKYHFDKNTTVEHVTIGDIKGMWVKSTAPLYPLKSDIHNLTSYDMTSKPSLEKFWNLIWQVNGINYQFYTHITEEPLSKEKAIEFAKDFMAAQK
ncbi:hypothetical protein [Ruminiclostridium papyrosolvens]|uniref:Uncharacterized protein n=1 Tax=Ruminiclostridium papyrosolvens C7 TaxID=1330534 RepID=U4R6K3_9FIRM|nr:hypothetical protein [Ruminiclostridium papyrosolvens]EPR14444.1 hypothetical protein L323_01105 [Ruminiclostridium papyrosolvens C7]